MDPSRLLGRSLWRLSANFSAQGSALGSLLDILSLKLRPGDERVLTMPLGEHAIVLRLKSSTLRLDVPRPVFGLFLPPAEAADDLRLHGTGEVAGILVHSLAVHSPHVRPDCDKLVDKFAVECTLQMRHVCGTVKWWLWDKDDAETSIPCYAATQPSVPLRCCFISAGPDPGSLFYPLPHMSGKIFIPAQPNENGKMLALNLITYLWHVASCCSNGDFGWFMDNLRMV